MLKFWSVINCIFVHWTKKLTLIVNNVLLRYFRQAIVPLVDNPTCNKNYEQVEDIENIGATQICAGLGERDSCQGDSGGPMLR